MVGTSAADQCEAALGYAGLVVVTPETEIKFDCADRNWEDLTGLEGLSRQNIIVAIGGIFYS